MQLCSSTFFGLKDCEFPAATASQSAHRPGRMKPRGEFRIDRRVPVPVQLQKRSCPERSETRAACGGVTLTMSSAFDNFNVNNKAIKRIMSEFKEMQKDTKNRDQYFAEPLEVRAALAQLGPTLPAPSPVFLVCTRSECPQRALLLQRPVFRHPPFDTHSLFMSYFYLKNNYCHLFMHSSLHSRSLSGQSIRVAL